MKTKNNLFDNIEEILIIFCFAFMTVMNFVNVVSRKFFANSFSFTEELTIMAFVWITMLGVSAGYKKYAHLGMDYFVGKFSAKQQTMFVYMSSFFSLLLGLTMLYYGTKMVGNQIMLKSATPALGFPSAFQGAAIPVGGILIIYRVIEDFLKRKKTIKLGKEIEG